MRESKFKVGDRVSTEVGIGYLTGIFSRSNGISAYGVELEDSGENLLFFENELELVAKKNYSMTIQIDIASNVVIATLFEDESPLAKGRGHLIHDGELGIAQAASYACKRLYENMGGTITKGGSWK